MAAQISVFPAISIRVFPGFETSAAALFPSSHPTSGLRPDHTAIQYRRVTTRTGELDGAKDVNGG
jgi:hypothetical protein